MARKNKSSIPLIPPDIKAIMEQTSDEGQVRVQRTKLNPGEMAAPDRQDNSAELSRETDRALQKSLRRMGKMSESPQDQALRKLHEALGDEVYHSLVGNPNGEDPPPASPIGVREPVVVSSSDRVQCSSCEKPVGEEFKFCPYCGALQKRWCPCGHRLRSEFQFCPQCGRSREEGVCDPPEDGDVPEPPAPEQGEATAGEALRDLLDSGEWPALWQALSLYQYAEEEVPRAEGKWNLVREGEEGLLESPEGEWIDTESELEGYFLFLEELEAPEGDE